MAESTALADLVQNRIDGLLADRTSILLAVSDDLAPLTDFSRDFLSGGKRFRARFCHHGWRAAIGPGHETPAPALVSAAAALEVFHAAALVHDDLIDNSDTRRGAPSAHRRFEATHRASRFTGDPAAFGRSAALLTGDLLLAFSDELIDDAVRRCPHPEGARDARAEFARMRLEVTAGQYLDVLEENAWSVHDEAEQAARAERVIVYKSAKYSVEAPLAIGAFLGGGRPEQLAALRAFALPLGIAYQLRDDLLGVYGDPAVTGKPSGDDLREGKRTLLIAEARRAMAPDARERLDSDLGDPRLGEEEIARMQADIRDSGAVAAIEAEVDRNLAAATAALADAPVDAQARAGLTRIAEEAVRRVA